MIRLLLQPAAFFTACLMLLSYCSATTYMSRDLITLKVKNGPMWVQGLVWSRKARNLKQNEVPFLQPFVSKCFLNLMLTLCPLNPKATRRILQVRSIQWISYCKNQLSTVYWEWHYSFLLSCTHKNGHFWSFFTIKSQGIKRSTILLFILNVLWCSNNLMQTNDFYNPFYV